MSSISNSKRYSDLRGAFLPNIGRKLFKKPSRYPSDPAQTNESVVNQFNSDNGVASDQRDAILDLFRQSGPEPLRKLIDGYLLSMHQDTNPAWQNQRPSRPRISYGTLPQTFHASFDLMGIGGMFATFNVWYQAHKHDCSCCIITHPHDIFSFSGWTLHPEEDMDQRLIAMFQTAALVLNELKGLLGSAEPPQSARFKSFKIDYSSVLLLLKESPAEFLKLLKVALNYVAYEFTDTEKRFARINLKRNAATLRALEEMARIGPDPEHDIVNMSSRVVFEVRAEAKLAAKQRLKARYGLQGEALTPDQVRENYGCRLPVLEDMARGSIEAVRYPGGHFVTGFKENALAALRHKGAAIYDNAVATHIIIDPQAGKHAVTLRLADGRQETLIADRLLMALGDYGPDVITVDGISTLFCVVTNEEEYRLHATGMGEGGTIHIVPVWRLEGGQDDPKTYYHLGKATNGAIMGRNPQRAKRLAGDTDFLSHLETHLRKIIPPESTLVWLAVTECGRPVSAKQGYSYGPVQPDPATARRVQMKGAPVSFEATGGCGLGGNTAIIPEVQKSLDAAAAK